MLSTMWLSNIVACRGHLATASLSAVVPVPAPRNALPPLRQQEGGRVGGQPPFETEREERPVAFARFHPDTR